MKYKAEMRQPPIASTTALLLLAGLLTLGVSSLCSQMIGKIDSRTAPDPLPPLQVQVEGHYLQTSDGKPFFWLGDTAWELIHHTTDEEAAYYLHKRSQQGFTVVQTVVLSEFNGVTEPSALGLRPFLDPQFSKVNPAYFDRVVALVDRAAQEGLYVALVPVWGDKLTAPWGSGPRLYTRNNLPAAHAFAAYLAGRLRDRTNVVWILGGDRPAKMVGLNNSYLTNLSKEAGFAADEDWTPVWRELAAGLTEGAARKPVILYHPQGGEQSSSTFLQNEPWLSINGMQSGHGGGHDQPVWRWIARDFAMTPPKPTLDLEPNYEDHPVNPWPTWNPELGYFRDLDVRKQAYRSVFAGACGVTYGHHAVWGFLNQRNAPVTFADMDWITGIDRPGGTEMQYLRALMESRPFFTRMPAQDLIEGDAGDADRHIEATRDRNGTYAMVYFPANSMAVTLNLTLLHAARLRGWWYDPQSGIGTLIGAVEGGAHRAFRSPDYKVDWVLVLDDPAVGYGPPGLPTQARTVTR